MKRIILSFLALISFTYGQYNIKSPYLQNPDKIIGYVDSCAAFWLNAYDPVNGGFYTNIDKYGKASGTQKNMQTQSRDAYGFVRAFMLTGNDVYLTKAKQALDFLYKHAWDNTNGGWYWELDKYGNPTSGNTNKDAFHQHYGLLGPMASFEATGDTLDWNWVMKGYQNNETKMWDSRAEYFGYYDYSSKNWSTKNNKSFNATVDAITTHLLYLYLLTKDQQYLDKSLQIIDNMKTHFVAGMDKQKIGFAEVYDANWNILSSETMTIMGHVLKTAWCFARVNQVYPDPTSISAARKLMDDVLAKGYDNEFGGPYKDYNRTTGQMLMWGNPDTAKAWWQMEQAIMAGLQMYQTTSDEQYLKMADETLDFFMKYFVDHTYGEVYENRTRRGAQTWGEGKGNPNKAGYHSIELGYYTYLYGKFFVKKEPITLYYDFQSGKERKVFLNPIELPFNDYAIKEVIYNDQPYTDYASQTHELHLPVNVGGKFKVTFEQVIFDDVVDEKIVPELFKLEQNYPNPFNPTTVISWQLAVGGHVTLKVYDVLGNEVATLVNEEKPAGVYHFTFNPQLTTNQQQLTSGVYFYQLRSSFGGGNFVETKKMILLR